MDKIIKTLADLYRENPIKALAELFFVYDVNEYNLKKAREDNQDRAELLKEQKEITESLEFVKGTFSEKDLKNVVANSRRLSDEKLKDFKVEKLLSKFTFNK